MQVVQEIIQHAKDHKRTVHVTWFDLQDAFGSVSHDLIPLVLKHYNLPPDIINYINNIYSKLQGRVVTKDWESEVFKFKRGVFQGDPYSSTIFLIVFNPLIQYIKLNKDKFGYNLNENFVNTTPFADDFNIISRNKTQHQKFIHNIEQKVASMGLILKPSKCKSLSIQAGKSNDVTFVLEDDKQVKTHIETLTESLYKFLGSLITFNSKPQDYFDHLSNIFKDKLENIDTSKV